MKAFLYSLAILSFSLLLHQAAYAQKDNFLKEYGERWEHSRQYLLAVAEAMPESAYGFKPTPEVMTFAEQLMHIALAMDWHAQTLLAGKELGYRVNSFKVGNRTKKEIMEVANRTFEEGAKVIADFDPAHYEDRLMYGKLSRTKRQIFLLLSDHVTHHRGQMLMYLRLKGVTPPQYIAFQ